MGTLGRALGKSLKASGFGAVTVSIVLVTAKAYLVGAEGLLDLIDLRPRGVAMVLVLLGLPGYGFRVQSAHSTTSKP